MKKSILSLLAIAIASVSVFTSCDKNDDGYGQSAKTQATTVQTSQPTTRDMSLVVCVTDAQAKFANMSVVLDIDGKEMTVDLSQMTQSAGNGFSDRALQMGSLWGANSVTTYKYDLSAFAGKTIKAKSLKATPKTVASSAFNGQKTAFVVALTFGNNNNGDVMSVEVDLNGEKDIQEACASVERLFKGKTANF